MIINYIDYFLLVITIGKLEVINDEYYNYHARIG